MELHVKNVLSFCNNFRQQEDRDITVIKVNVFLQNIPLTCLLTLSLYSYLIFLKRFKLYTMLNLLKQIYVFFFFYKLCKVCVTAALN